ncbi:MAG TPA: pyridoxamine 5'-phosphate oxidase family protein [Puia sp.]|nr:pyridoxamine 5'-phosphate oxidase family protein [Puia sp.]
MGPITTEVKEFVNRVKLGFAATVSPDGTPNLSPKGTTLAWDDQRLVFADIHSPRTVSNLLVNPSIEINVVDIFTRKGFRFKGIATVHKEGEFYESVVKHYRSAGSLYQINHIVSIKVEELISVWSPAYDNNLTEEEIKKRWIEYWSDIYSISR